MALVTVKLFGILRMDTLLSAEELSAETLNDVFTILNRKVQSGCDQTDASQISRQPPELSFRDTIVYINGKRTLKKHCRLKDADEIWLMSPASGG